MTKAMNKILWLTVTITVLCSTVLAAEPATMPTTAPTTAPTTSPADQALKQLQDGNARYVAGKSEHPHANAARREDTVKNGQHPIVTILACADSRCGLDILFDQGIGDIFTVRVAGNVAGTDEIASIEYGTGHLGTPLLVILGHTKCGAVTAVVKGDHVHGNLPALVANIVPAVKKAQEAHPDLKGDALVPAAVEANVWQAMDDLFRRSETVRELVKEGKLKVVGGIQDIQSGKVQWLGEPVNLKQMLEYTGGEGETHEQKRAADASGTHEPAVPQEVEPNASAGHDAAAAAAVAGATEHAASDADSPAHDVAPTAVNQDSIKADSGSVSELASSSSIATVSGRPEDAGPAKIKAVDKASGGLSLWYLALAGVGLAVLGFIVLKAKQGSIGNQDTQGERSMFKNMKLGAKIGAGFASLIIIAVALGGLAIWSMNGVKTTTVNLAEAKVPTVTVANQLERNSLHTMYAMRGYAYTEDKKFLDQMQKSLTEVKANLKEAQDHAAKFDEQELAQNSTKAEAKAKEYEQLALDTVAKVEALEKDRLAMNVAATQYMKLCDEFMAGQAAKMKEDFNAITGGKGRSDGTKVDEKELNDRLAKIMLCNDIADLGSAIRIGNWKSQTERDPKLFQETQQKFVEVNRKLDDLKAITRHEDDLKRIDECRAAGKAYSDAMSGFLTNWLAREDLNKKRGEVADAVLEAATETAAGGMKNTAEASEAAASSLSTASTTMIIGLSIGVLVGIVLAIFIARSITGPINRIIAGLTSGSEQTSSAATQVSSASQSLAQGASEQAASIEETTSSVEEMSSMTKQNAANATEAKTLAAGAKNAADKGAEAMTRMSRAIEDIKKSSDQTAKILKTIDEIAFQTNLLALNAAVEAARAGEAGKGFAVVAEEVRNLAQRSAEAAKNTANMIEESVKNAENGVQITQEVAKALDEIAGGARKVNDLVGEIAAASNEQAQGIEQISTAVGQMDTVTQQNAANAEESASASEELSAQAEELNKMVAELRALVGGSGAQASFRLDTAESAKAPRASKGSTAATTMRAPQATHAGASARHGEQDMSSF